MRATPTSFCICTLDHPRSRSALLPRAANCKINRILELCLLFDGGCGGQTVLQNVTECSDRNWAVALRPEVDLGHVDALFVMAEKSGVKKDSRTPPFRRATSQNSRLASNLFGCV